MGDKKQEENKGGRPETTQEEKDAIVSKLEPYLKSGLSIKKALSEAQFSRTTFYRIMERDEEFRDKIGRYRQFVSVMLNNVIVRELQDIVKRRNENQKLTKDDHAFIWRFATTSTLTREEFGERKDIGLIDPEVELNKLMGLIEESSTKGEDNGTTK